MVKLSNIHPGEILLEEFLKPLNLSAYRLSKDSGVPQSRITADTTLRLSMYFGNSAKFWLGLQDEYDTEEELNINKQEIHNIKRREENAA